MITKEPLDEETYLRVHSAIDLAKVRGVDAAELLHRRGLLACPALMQQARREALREVHTRVASFRPAEFLQRNTSKPSSPKDMYDAILVFIETLMKEQ